MEALYDPMNNHVNDIYEERNADWGDVPADRRYSGKVLDLELVECARCGNEYHTWYGEENAKCPYCQCREGRVIYSEDAVLTLDRKTGKITAD